MVRVKLRGAELRRIMVRRNLSQNNLAKRLEISSGYMAQLLNGERCPSPVTRQKLQDYFKDCSFDELFKTFGRVA